MTFPQENNFRRLRVFAAKSNKFARQIIELLKQLTSFPTAAKFSPISHRWLSLSLIISLVFSLQSLVYAFSDKYIVQDDARQHIFWLRRFLDSDLFPQDIIADYFQSVAPPGYVAIYRFFAYFGVDPFILAKLIPLVLGLISTYYCFRLTVAILPTPGVGFLASLLLNQSLWMEDDLVSATPRAFIYAIFLAFLVYLLENRLILTLICLSLAGLFYPQILLLCLAILTVRLIDLKNVAQLPRKILNLSSFTWQFCFSREKKRYWLWCLALLTSFLILHPYLFSTNQFGAVIDPAVAKNLAEFRQVGGVFARAFYFHDNPIIFWLLAPRSGLLCLGFMSPLVCLAFFLPVWVNNPDKYPLAAKITTKSEILKQIILASLAMFFLSHLLIFKLHFPSRYVYHSFRLVLAIAAGIAGIMWLDKEVIKLKHDFAGEKLKKLSLKLLISLILVILPFVTQFSLTHQLYVKGEARQTYEFLQRQDKDIMVASLSIEADNIPTFSKRSTLVGREYALPYHTGYYQQISQRILALIEAQYSADATKIKEFIDKYSVDFWLIDNNAFSLEYIQKKDWLVAFTPESVPALKSFQQGEIPAVLSTMTTCTVLQEKNIKLLATRCILEQIAD